MQVEMKREFEEEEEEEEAPAIYRVASETLQQIFMGLPLRQIVAARAVSKHFNRVLSAPTFVDLLSARTSLPLITLRHSLHAAFDPSAAAWLHLPLSFLPSLLRPAAASPSGLLYVWADPSSLLVCNPLTRRFRTLPRLGSAWARHASVLADSRQRVMLLTELAALVHAPPEIPLWAPFSSNLPSKPRSPVMAGSAAYALCDVGSPWRSQWKLFRCPVPHSRGWSRLDRQDWGDVFDILKRPRLLRGESEGVLLMAGGLRSSFSLNSPCSTILILRLDLDTLEWDEAGRMPPDFFRWFQESPKFKLFGGGLRLCFSAKRHSRLAFWDRSAGPGPAGHWRWIDGVPAGADAGGLCRGFVLEATLTRL